MIDVKKAHNYTWKCIIMQKDFANFCKNFGREKPYFNPKPFLNGANLFDTASAVLHTLSLT